VVQILVRQALLVARVLALLHHVRDTGAVVSGAAAKARALATFSARPPATPASQGFRNLSRYGG